MEHGARSVVRQLNGNPRFEGMVWAQSRASKGGPGSHATYAEGHMPEKTQTALGI